MALMVTTPGVVWLPARMRPHMRNRRRKHVAMMSTNARLLMMVMLHSLAPRSLTGSAWVQGGLPDWLRC